MSRRRIITSEISTDDRIAELYERAGVLALLLYTWMIPHADDDGTIRGTPREIKLKVLPGVDCTTDDVERALQEMRDAGLIEWDREYEVVGFPPESFYKYQSDIRVARRRTLPLTEYLRRTHYASAHGQDVPKFATAGEDERNSPKFAESGADGRNSPKFGEDERKCADHQTSPKCNNQPECVVDAAECRSPSPSPLPLPLSTCKATHTPGEGGGVGEEEGTSSLSADADVCVQPEQIVALWNAVCSPPLPAVRILTEQRRKKIRARMVAKERCSMDWWLAYFQRIRASPFCCGDGHRGWRADLDWAIRSEDVVARVLEGKYDPPSRASTSGPVLRLLHGGSGRDAGG